MELAIIQANEIINKVGYASEHDNEIGILKKQKILMHRFINKIGNDDMVYYYAAIPKRNIEGFLSFILFIPFIRMDRYGILINYDYYNTVYKTNTLASMINKKYVINHKKIGTKSPFDNIKREDQKMKLKFKYLFNIFN